MAILKYKDPVTGEEKRVGIPSDTVAREHIADTNNPHGVTIEQIGAAASEHNHDGVYATVDSTLRKVELTQEEYNALSEKDPNTIYIVTDAESEAVGSGHYAGSSAPSNTDLLWIDTSEGIIKYWDGSAWKAVGAVFG